MNEKYICSICGGKYNELNSYLNCVNNCCKKVEKEKKELEDKKRAEEINAALYKIKQAKLKYELLLEEFRADYPEEFEINFGSIQHDLDAEPDNCNGCENYHCDGCDGEECICKIEHHCEGDASCRGCEIADNVKPKIIEMTIDRNEKDEPEINAKVNGKKVDKEHTYELLKNPEVYWIAKMLGLV